jgi:hypothetical protein
VVHDFDDRRLGKGPAEAIADFFRLAIKERSSRQAVAPSTIKARESHARAYAAGKPWAKERYDGGRTGPTPPDTSRISRAWFFSGRIANGIFVRENESEKSWAINVPANRLNNLKYAQNDGQYRRMLDSLLELLPELSDSQKLLKDKGVNDAIRASIRDLITVASDRNKALLARRNKALLGLLRGVF